ncbi:MAG: VOC family protein, partial [Ruminiclostridium sp.]
MHVDSNTVMQIAIVVRDIEKTAQNFAEMFNIEKPKAFYLSDLGETYAEYYGVPTDSKMKLLVFRMGSLDLELIEPDDKPSTFKKFLEEHGE